MTKGLLVAAAVAAMFPYTQVLPNESYTQPYALMLAVAASLFILRRYLDRAPGRDVLSLLSLAVVGTVLFLASCLPTPSAQDVKSLLMYVSPLFFSASSFLFAIDHPVAMRRVVSVAAVVWLVVGVVQATVDPSFASRWVGNWNEAAEVVVMSGRGVIGLAPEPTHHGFHLLVMAAVLYLLGGKRSLIFACILAAVILARSSSTVLSLAVGAGVCLLLRPRKMLIPVVVAVTAAFGVFGVLARPAIDEPIRVVSLAASLLENPVAILSVDYSVNLRLGGLVVGTGLVADSWLWPHGLSNAEWLARIPQIREANPWLFDISTAGIPSGIIIVAYQLGWIGMVLLTAPLFRIVRASRSSLGLWLMLSAVAVFLGQFLISAPGFGVLHGCALAATLSRRPDDRHSSVTRKDDQ